MTSVDSAKPTRQRRRSASPAKGVEEPAAAPLASPQESARRVIVLGFLGSLLMWAALPPLGWSLAAWVAPLPWLLLVRDEKLRGRRPYVWLYLAGFAHWMAVLQGIRLAHWATYFGWIVLSAYLAVYLPAFVALTRVAVHRLKTPLAVAAPVVWTGLEYARGYVATGFSMALFGHSQVRWTPLIQISDLVGAYGVSFLVMFVAACLAACFPRSYGDKKEWRWRPLIVGALAIVAVWGYGQFRLSQEAIDATRPALRAAMVQAWVDTIFEYDPERDVETFAKYSQLSQTALDRHPDLDAIIWPEWVYTDVRPLVTRDDVLAPPPGVSWPPDVAQRIDEFSAGFHRKTAALAAQLNNRPTLLVGVSAQHYGRNGVAQYNSAAQISPTGEVLARYDKMHPVMFGEYVPFGDLFPWVYRLTPLGSGLARGQRPQAFEVAGLRLSPSVCFESTVPHLIRRHLVELARRGEKPDVLVNHTNDGWFWGSSMIDLHLNCGVFRAVEHRTPMLIAANTGLSAWIDGNGRLREVGPRFAEAILVADVRPDRRTSLYTRFGDWFAALCLAFCGVVGGTGVWRRLRPDPGTPVAGRGA